MEKTYKATIYKVDGSKERVEISHNESLECLQKIVGGLIEVIFIVPILDELKNDFTAGKDLIINEEGLLLDLPTNPWSELITLGSRWQNEIFRGDIVLVDGTLQ